MKPLLFVIAAACLGLGLTPGLQADEGQALADKAIKAVGGEAKVAGLKNAIYKFKGLVKEGNNMAELTGEVAVRGLDQYRIDLQVEVMGQNRQMLVIMNGDQGWVKTMDQVMDAPPEVITAVRQAFLAGRGATLLALLKDKDMTLSPIGEVKVGEKSALGLKVLRKDFKEFDLYIDKDSHLLLKAETKFMGPGNKEAEFEYVFSEPKDINGLKHFSKMLLNIKSENKTLVEFELVELKVDQKLEDGLFARP